MPSHRGQRLVARGAERPQTQARRALCDAAQRPPATTAAGCECMEAGKAPRGRPKKRAGRRKGGNGAHPRGVGGTWGPVALATADVAWGLGCARARAQERERSARAEERARAAAALLQAAARRRQAAACRATAPCGLAAVMQGTWLDAKWAFVQFGKVCETASAQVCDAFAAAAACFAPAGARAAVMGPAGRQPSRAAAAAGMRRLAASRRELQRRRATSKRPPAAAVAGVHRAPDKGGSGSKSAAPSRSSRQLPPVAAGLDGDSEQEATSWSAPPAMGPFKQVLPLMRGRMDLHSGIRRRGGRCSKGTLRGM